MPHIAISMYPGRTDERKEEIAKGLLEAMEKLDFPDEEVSISVEDIEADNFQETINGRLGDENKLIISSRHIK